MQQKQLGQFYTHKNIFKTPAFIKWFNAIPAEKKETILEPFAGSNGIIKMLDNLGFVKNFISYDIMPRDKSVVYKNTLESFPLNHHVVVTNPPFLAKNSASRRLFNINFNDYNDLYEICLNKCLEHTEYVAAIIPESFITNELFDKSRLYAIISLAEKKIFKDTEHPVCLALFNPSQNITNKEVNKEKKCFPLESNKIDYKLYINDDYLGSYQELLEKEKQLLNYEQLHNYKVFWHHPEGQIGLQVIDATDKRKTIQFIDGEIIDSNEVSLQSRLRTRILITDNKNKPLSQGKIKKIIKQSNIFLKNYRKETNDVFLTAFKGLRSDGVYRRRLDFTKARIMLDAILSNMC